MEASQFAAGADLATNDDPFGGSDGMEDFEQGADDPFKEEPPLPTSDVPVEGMPVVDAEGQVVEAQAPNGQTQVAPEAAEPTPDPEATAKAAEEQQERMAKLKAQQEASEALPRATVGSDGQPLPPPIAAPSSAAAPSPEATPSPTAEANVTPAGVEGKPTPGPTPGQTGPDGEALTAPESPPAKEAKKKPHGTVRGYYLLVPEGPSTYRQLDWYADKAGNVTTKEKGKKTNIANVASKREALAIGYTALGSPAEGVKLAAVPVSYFEIKHVQVGEEPVRRRPLKIS